MEIREGDTGEVFEEDGEVGGVRRTNGIFYNSLIYVEELVNSIDPTAEFTRTILAEEFRQSESTSEVYTTSYIPDEEDEE